MDEPFNLCNPPKLNKGEISNLNRFISPSEIGLMLGLQLGLDRVRVRATGGFNIHTRLGSALELLLG